MKRFLLSVQQANEELEGLKEVLTQMNSLTRKVSGASGKKEAHDLEDALSRARGEFVEGIEEVKANIASLKKRTDATKKIKEQPVRRQHISCLVSRVKRLVEEFSQTQTDFGHEERERLKSQYIIAKPAATSEELEALANSEDASQISKTFQGGPQTAHEQATEAERKHKSIKDISAGIVKVTDMTQQLNLMVHETGEHEDKVHIKATKTEKRAKKAEKDLESALRSQKLARMFKRFVIVVALLVGFAILVGFLVLIVFVVIMAINAIKQYIPNSSTPDSGGGQPPAPGGQASSGGSQGGSTNSTSPGSGSQAPPAPSPEQTILQDLQGIPGLSSSASLKASPGQNKLRL